VTDGRRRSNDRLRRSSDRWRSIDWQIRRRRTDAPRRRSDRHVEEESDRGVEVTNKKNSDRVDAGST
jgi:hypothetical protein